MAKIDEKTVRKVLFEVMDPEMNISIMDLGLVYGVKVANKKVEISMTLTTLGCPLFPIIEKEINQKLATIGVEDLDIRLTFNPPWSFEKMTDRARAMLGL